MIVLGDQPLLTPASLARLIAAFRTVPEGRSILVPTSGGQRGNPVLFAARHIPAIQAGRMKLGCRRLIETYPDQVALIEMADDAFTQDCDTPEITRPCKRPRNGVMIDQAEVTDLIAAMTRRAQPYALATVVRTVSATAAKAGAKAVILADGTSPRAGSAAAARAARCCGRPARRWRMGSRG